MIKKALLIVLCWTMTVLYVTSCCGPTDYCTSIETVEFEVYSPEGNLVSGTDTSVNGSNFTLRLTISNQTNLCRSKVFIPGVTAAYAKSCRGEVYFTNDTVKSISITADRDYDENTPSNSGINDFFDVPPISQLNDLFEFEDVRTFDIKAVRSPNTVGSYTYSIRLFMTSGKILEATSQPVKLEI